MGLGGSIWILIKLALSAVFVFFFWECPIAVAAACVIYTAVVLHNIKIIRRNEG